MRIIRDNVYLFSIARTSSGKIVACRAIDGDRAIGKNIDDVLCIEKSEIEYAVSRSSLEEYRSVCLSCCPGGKRRVVAFFDFLYRSSSLILAVVFDNDAASVSKALLSLGEGIADPSPALTLLANNKADFSEEDRQTFMYVSYVYGCIVPLGRLRASPLPDNPEALRGYVEYIADFVGVDVSYAAQTDLDGYITIEQGVVFSGGFLTACLLIAAMLARRYSRERMLEVTAVQGNKEISVRFCFDTDADGIDDGLTFLSDVSKAYGIYLEYSISDGRAEITVSPVYSDVGLAGVKERDELPRLSDFI